MMVTPSLLMLILLKRVNTPEMKDSPLGEARRMKDFLETQLDMADKIKVVTSKSARGKYGRQTCELFTKQGRRKWVNINDLIIEEGYPNVKRGVTGT